jgi:hypothetical protein
MAIGINEGNKQNGDVEYGHAGTTEMVPLTNKAVDERIAKREECVIIVVVCQERGALETAAEVGANDESKNQQKSCSRKLREFVFCTACVVFSFCFLYSFYDRIPAASRILGVITISGSYCNYIFWECKNHLGFQKRSQET